MSCRLTLFAVGLLACGLGAQTTWYVRGDGTPGGSGSAGDPFGSIQQAIDHAAVAGDEILVLPGIYAETLDLRGKELRVRSASGAVATVLDGPGPGATLTATRGEGPGTRIEGFRFANRRTTQRLALHASGASHANVRDCEFVGHRGAPFGAGSAVLSEDGAHLAFRRCLFEDNAADPFATNAAGGALLARRGASLVLEFCSLRRNRARLGAAIAALTGSDVAVERCTFEHNQLATGGGSGLYLAGGSRGRVEACRFFDHGNAGSGGALLADGADLDLRTSHFARNHAAHYGGALALRRSTALLADCWFDWNLVLHREDPMAGGALSLSQSTVVVERSRFTGNRARSGGAIAVLDGSELLVDACAFLDNTAAVEGGAFHVLGSQLTLDRSLLVDNASAVTGGGIEIAGVATLRMSHVTCEGQSARVGGGVHVLAPASAAIADSILRTNRPDQIRGAASVQYCDVEGGHSGAGNFDLDPRYVDRVRRDFHLTAGSPCRDAGDPGLTGSAWRDFEGDPRHGARADVGLDEYQPLWHAYRGEPLGGGSVILGIQGDPTAPILFAVSPLRLEPPVPTPFGDFALDHPLVIVALGSTDPSGLWVGNLPLPSIDHPLEVHSQVLVGARLSVRRSLTLY